MSSDHHADNIRQIRAFMGSVGLTRFRAAPSTDGFSHASLTAVFRHKAKPGSPSEDFQALAAQALQDKVSQKIHNRDMEGHALSHQLVHNAGPKEVGFYNDGSQLLIKRGDTRVSVAVAYEPQTPAAKDASAKPAARRPARQEAAAAL